MTLPIGSDSEALALAKRDNRAELEQLVSSEMTLRQIERALADVRRMDAASRAKYFLMEGCLLGIAKRDHFQDKPASDFTDWAYEQTGLSVSGVNERIATATRIVGLNPSQITKKLTARFRSDGKLSSYSDLANPNAIPVRRREYVDDVDAIMQRTRLSKLRDDALDKAKEENEIAKLAKQIIDIGFKVLATKLHPDKQGGNKTAMARLNSARKLLLAACDL